MTGGEQILDRIVEVVPEFRVVAEVNVPATLTVFDSHFPRFPVLPGVLLLDRIVTAAELLAPEGLRHQRGVRGIRFRRYVRPGDRIRITIEAVSRTPAGFECRATAAVDDHTVATVRSLRYDTGPGSRTRVGGIR